MYVYIYIYINIGISWEAGGQNDWQMTWTYPGNDLALSASKSIGTSKENVISTWTKHSVDLFNHCWIWGRGISWFTVAMCFKVNLCDPVTGRPTVTNNRYVCSQLSLETKNPKHHWGGQSCMNCWGTTPVTPIFPVVVEMNIHQLGAPGSSLVSGGPSSLSSAQWRKCLELGSLARQQEIEVNVVLM